MRILLVNTVPTYKNGITNVIFNIVSSSMCPNLNYGYVSISEPDAYYRKKLEEYNIPLYIIPRKILNPLKYIISLKKVAKDYDIIHVHGNSATMVLEMIAAKLSGVKLRIAHSHNTTCSLKLVDKLMRPLFYKLCNGRLSCGEEAGKWLFGQNDFVVINNGINSEKFKFNQSDRENFRNRYNLSNKFVIGHIGNLVDQKNHIFLLDVFYHILKIQPNSNLLLIGDGPLKEVVRNRAEELKIADKLFFMGSVDNPQNYLSAVDLIIMPSLFEGFPLTLVEEQANGLKCLVADTITNMSNLTGFVEFLSLNTSSKDWAIRAINLSKDTVDSRKSRSEKAKELISLKGYDIKATTSKLIDFYHRKFN